MVVKERNKSAIELSEEQLRIAVKDRAHLKEWLHASGRQWLVLNGDHLVDALPWPDGVETFMQIVACYRDHRATIDTGEKALIKNPTTGNLEEVLTFYPETLTLTEMDRAIRWLVGQITNLDSDWKLENPPL